MRFSTIASVAISTLSIAALAGVKAEETTSKSEDNKVEPNNENGKIAASSAGGYASSRLASAINQQKTEVL